MKEKESRNCTGGKWLDQYMKGKKCRGYCCNVIGSKDYKRDAVLAAEKGDISLSPEIRTPEKNR